MKIESFGGKIILFHLRNIYRVRQKKIKIIIRRET